MSAVKSSARELVEKFLRLIEARDVDAAQRYLAPGTVMTFPGASKFKTMGELIESSKKRYQHVRKTFDGFDEVTRDGVTTVYIRGFLNGAWPDGSPFENIRYIDRFEIKDGQIIDQQVWNDMADARAKLGG